MCVVAGDAMKRQSHRGDPWYQSALYEVWLDMMRTGRRMYRQRMSDRTGDEFPVDPIFRDFYKFRLWACFCWRYRMGETDGWCLERRNLSQGFSPENCRMVPRATPVDNSESKTVLCASRASYKSEIRGRWGGLSKTRLYSIWSHMLRRCYCEADAKHWPDYGGRGIRVCDEWRLDFMVFWEWAWSHGYDPALTLDRIDPDGNYCPENCRWATVLEQLINTREKHGRYVNKRMRVSDARAILAVMPDNAVVTLVSRRDALPDALPPECDYPAIPEPERIDAERMWQRGYRKEDPIK